MERPNENYKFPYKQVCYVYNWTGCCKNKGGCSSGLICCKCFGSHPYFQCNDAPLWLRQRIKHFNYSTSHKNKNKFNANNGNSNNYQNRNFNPNSNNKQ